jgi:hypothetical protein
MFRQLNGKPQALRIPASIFRSLRNTGRSRKSGQRFLHARWKCHHCFSTTESTRLPAEEIHFGVGHCPAPFRKTFSAG